MRQKVCVIGSSADKDDIMEVQKGLALDGHIVLGMHVFNIADELNLGDQEIASLVDMHKEMIDLSDFVVVVNPSGRLSDRSNETLRYAIDQGKQIFDYMAFM